MIKKALLYTLLPSLICLFNIGSAFSQSQGQVKGSMIYHFTKYMQWPASKASGDFVIGVVGNSDTYSMLQTLAKSKKVGSRTIVVKKISSASQGSGCSIIYLSADQIGQFDAAKNAASTGKALLVTEKSGMGKKGAGINFIQTGGKVKFEINESSIKANGIKVDSKLAAMGVKVG